MITTLLIVLGIALFLLIALVCRLFAEILEQHRKGIPPDPQALAAEHPDLAPEILEGIAMLSEIDETLVDSAADRVLGDD